MSDFLEKSVTKVYISTLFINEGWVCVKVTGKKLSNEGMAPNRLQHVPSSLTSVFAFALSRAASVTRHSIFSESPSFTISSLGSFFTKYGAVK